MGGNEIINFMFETINNFNENKMRIEQSLKRKNLNELLNSIKYNKSFRGVNLNKFNDK